jgi:hypothetical protein
VLLLESLPTTAVTAPNSTSTLEELVPRPLLVQPLAQCSFEAVCAATKEYRGAAAHPGAALALGQPLVQYRAAPAGEDGQRDQELLADGQW